MAAVPLRVFATRLIPKEVIFRAAQVAAAPIVVDCWDSEVPPSRAEFLQACPRVLRVLSALSLKP